jgi:hypothetical protein
VVADIKNFPFYPLTEKNIFRFQVRLLKGSMTETFLKQHKQLPMRTIDIRGSQTLEDLHNAIFKAFDRYDPHFYEFQVGGKKPNDSKACRYGLTGFNDELFEPDEDARTTSIVSLIIMPGDFFFIGSILVMTGGIKSPLIQLTLCQKGKDVTHVL